MDQCDDELPDTFNGHDNVDKEESKLFQKGFSEQVLDLKNVIRY